MAYLAKASLLPQYCPSLRFPVPGIGKYDWKKSNGPIWIDAADVPSEALLLSGHKSLPNVVMIRAIPAVNQAVKEIIEDLEPGVHQFVPTSIRREKGSKPIVKRDGSVLNEPYFRLNIRHVVDAFDLERSTFRRDASFKDFRRVDERSHVFLRKKMIESIHLWQGYQHGLYDVYISEQLRSNIAHLRFPEIKFIQLAEV